MNGAAVPVSSASTVVMVVAVSVLFVPGVQDRSQNTGWCCSIWKPVLTNWQSGDDSRTSRVLGVYKL